MLILGIETSCDETSASVVKDGTKVLSFVLATSSNFHNKTGGVVPEIAARKQVEYIIPVLDEALKNAGIIIPIRSGSGIRSGIRNVGAIAVANAPGLVGSLVVGVETAKALAFAWDKPLIPVNHLKGHIYSAWLNDRRIIPRFPLISLVVSGGHTELYYIKDYGNYEWLGGTRDDAAGEAFDKVARALGLGYPGGPLIDSMASKIQVCGLHPNKNKYKAPRPLINSNDFDFSFSGLKTSVFRHVQSSKYKLSTINSISYEFREAVVDILIKKTFLAAKKYNVKTVCVVGGVSANKRLRERLKEYEKDYTIIVPPIKYCMDNAAMIATAAYFDGKPQSLDKVQAFFAMDSIYL